MRPISAFLLQIRLHWRPCDRTQSMTANGLTAPNPVIDSQRGIFIGVKTRDADSGPLQLLLGKFQNVRRSGAGFTARCPAHEDRKASLSVTQRDGKILLHCFAGCTTEAICTAVGIQVSELFCENGNRARISAVYGYTDERGELLYENVRYEPKDFKQRRPDGRGGWIWNLGNIRRVPYRLPELAAARSVLIVEGEKDCESARKVGIVATNSKNWQREFSDHLSGKHVAIIADADEPGRKIAASVAQTIAGKASSLKLCELPGSKDLSDWIAAGGTRTALLAFIESQPEWKPEDRCELGSLSTAELFTVQETKIEWLAWPFAATGLATITDALPKVGKTIFFLQGILAARANRPFLGSATRPMRIVYVSEQSAASLAVQVREVGFTGSEPIEELRWITREFWSRFVFAEFLERLERQFLRDGLYNALVFDCWHTIARLEDENAAAEVNRLGNLTIDVAARNKLALALGRHDRKSGGEVGLSGRSSIQLSGLVDVILHLVRVSGHEAQRRLEILGRVPGLPPEQLIELVGDRYVNCGEPETVLDETVERVKLVRQWLHEFPTMTAPEIVTRFAKLRVEISESAAKRYRDKAKKPQ